MTLPPFPAFNMQKIALYLAIALGVLAIVGLTYCTGRHDGKTGEVAKEQARTIQVQKDVGAANENAATARVADATKAEQQKRELQDALNITSDPDKQRALRGCIIMRQQGRDTKDIPACR